MHHIRHSRNPFVGSGHPPRQILASAACGKRCERHAPRDTESAHPCQTRPSAGAHTLLLPTHVPTSPLRRATEPGSTTTPKKDRAISPDRCRTFGAHALRLRTHCLSASRRQTPRLPYLPLPPQRMQKIPSRRDVFPFAAYTEHLYVSFGSN